jgi:hypothetical protein
MDPQYCCDGDNGYCQETHFEVFAFVENGKTMVKLVCLGCGHEMIIGELIEKEDK